MGLLTGSARETLSKRDVAISFLEMSINEFIGWFTLFVALTYKYTSINFLHNHVFVPIKLFLPLLCGITRFSNRVFLFCCAILPYQGNTDLELMYNCVCNG